MDAAHGHIVVPVAVVVVQVQERGGLCPSTGCRFPMLSRLALHVQGNAQLGARLPTARRMAALGPGGTLQLVFQQSFKRNLVARCCM